ncbi:MAG: VWA domain-containing protein [Parvibaculum sp.]|uniref:VWA domain-containing protein n=1 Tax=Parvibaculum sp. TaxID=2024848 RepID=UPI00284E34F1|nr:VWA domain-containing protein [Parvibaculum sp.]MDR3500032.1 VWA domain-containing protein [Parvibaculum sp.]
MPLSTDWTALKSKIDGLAASGNTNTTIGLIWGWNMLTPGSPLSNGADPAANLDKVIVYMTDGSNTENRFSSNQSAIDARMALACTAVKADNIKIYTIRLMDGNATLLRNCATEPGMYYSVTAASQLDSVFASIAQALSNLRVSQ